VVICRRGAAKIIIAPLSNFGRYLHLLLTRRQSTNLAINQQFSLKLHALPYGQAEVLQLFPHSLLYLRPRRRCHMINRRRVCCHLSSLRGDDRRRRTRRRRLYLELSIFQYVCWLIVSQRYFYIFTH